MKKHIIIGTIVAVIIMGVFITLGNFIATYDYYGIAETEYEINQVIEAVEYINQDNMILSFASNGDKLIYRFTCHNLIDGLDYTERTMNIGEMALVSFACGLLYFIVFNERTN